MTKFNFHFFICLLMVFSLTASMPRYAFIKKSDIEAINHTLLYDLYLSHEIVQKNGNISTLVDFFPNIKKTSIKEVRTESNIGDMVQTLIFNYSSTNQLQNFIYQVDGRQFNYQIDYDKGKVVSISVGGKKRISINYQKNGLIKSLNRETSNGIAEYSFEYLEKENKVNVKLVVINGDKRQESTSKEFVKLTSDFRMSDYNFYVYSGKEYNYSFKGDLQAFTVTGGDEPVTVAFEYKYDEKENWIERKSNKLYFKRTIQYN